MNTQIGSETLSILTSFNNITRTVQECLTIIDSKKPSDLVQYLDQITKNVKAVESVISLNIIKLSELFKMYHRAFDELNDKRYSLFIELNERKQLNFQMNLNGTIYNEIDLLKEIYVSYENLVSPSISNVSSDTLFNPKDYSYLAIIKRMENEKTLLKEISTIADDYFKKAQSMLAKYNNYLMEFKFIINDAELINDLTMPDENVAQERVKYIRGLIGEYSIVESLNQELDKLFKIYLDIENNYTIYTKAITGYAATVLESIFNPNDTYEL